jgi:YidC/Oxa1 family membrane protein insertase
VGNIFHIIFVQPILNLLVGFYKLFLTIGLPGAFGFSIVAITILVRIVLHPFFKQQMDTAKKMQDIKPKLDTLSKKHKNDSKTLQQEQMRVYQEAGVNPAAGCLFAVIQIPVFLSLYRTLQLFLQDDKAGTVLKQINGDLYFPFLKISSIDPHFFGLNLAISPSHSGSLLFIIFPIITAALQYLQTRVTMPAMQAAVPTAAPEEKDKDKKGSNTGEEFQKAMNTQMKYFFPIMIGYFSYTLPLGLSIYWNIFSIFTVLQHFHINRGKKELELIDASGENVLEPEYVELKKAISPKKKKK